MTKIKIQQVRSRIGRPKDQKRTLDALGLKKINSIGWRSKISLKNSIIAL